MVAAFNSIFSHLNIDDWSWMLTKSFFAESQSLGFRSSIFQHATKKIFLPEIKMLDIKILAMH